MRRDKTAVFLATAIFVVSCAGAASAQQLRDHLQCFKIKDSLTKQKYSADLAADAAGLPAVQAGCTIKVPAKQWCVDISKQNVAPAPPGATAGAAAQEYLCYKAKCPKTKFPSSGQDQFGNRNFTVKKTFTVCAPVTGGCEGGETLCGETCVDTTSDEANCGACGEACAGDQTCVASDCTLACGVAETACGESECCSVLETCVEGACQPLL